MWHVLFCHVYLLAALVVVMNRIKTWQQMLNIQLLRGLVMSCYLRVETEYGKNKRR